MAKKIAKAKIKVRKLSQRYLASSSELKYYSEFNNAISALRGRVPEKIKSELETAVETVQENVNELTFRNVYLVFPSGTYRDDDLIQDGLMAIMEAAYQFDFQRGTRFSTAAVWYIRHGISNNIRAIQRGDRYKASPGDFKFERSPSYSGPQISPDIYMDFKKAVHSLPLEDKKILALRYGLDPKEFGLSEEEVKGIAKKLLSSKVPSSRVKDFLRMEPLTLFEMRAATGIDKSKMSKMDNRIIETLREKLDSEYQKR
jgi:RNA polymerase sigma factor (sigma-70 family)